VTSSLCLSYSNALVPYEGKTTLMDVIAMRKRSGTVTGDIRLNGFPQDRVSFRRCSGYVEQFDVQTPELTVRETILFSARLRLDPDIVSTEVQREAFVDQVISEVELTDLADSLVGADDGIGLSFEQKKRLSIAVELAASPSVIFLDEVSSHAISLGIITCKTSHAVYAAYQWFGCQKRTSNCQSFA
jgi:ABC-type multidrug transport system ATPase subunit